MTAGPGEEVISLKGFGHGHWTRSLLFDRAGQKLYVGVGSGSNVSPGEYPAVSYTHLDVYKRQTI